ncbi:amidophosphoribosyltransferase [Desulfomonile tiedjei]|uniref:Amidophosphoribosyltransferase n=1 Tax=Desulfomonile tiedjei (strain ATCC 49306 / DSM 6799 / DCB-1) TaxID=706587 RepID=I4C898_DESTA|nr:amidophosphoribosyltransferase [Desulfomonile tiedjei]AFM25789.1 amidophosphoribosyltransferase [Desulfomonile tiedjei DSM 6799]
MDDLSSKREACGIFGVYGAENPADLIYLGLYALQHRGQESAGIVVSDGTSVVAHKGMGLAPDVFKNGLPANMKGHLGIGHVRYSTTGSSMLKNAQPFLVEQIDRAFALGHNGNIVNISELRRKLEARGAIFQTSTDSELIAHLVLHKKGSLEERLIKAFDELKGAWSLVMLTPDAILAARDPFGFRPLCIGRKGDAIIFASETCALDIIDAEYIRDVEPGELVIADHNGIRSIQGPRRSHSAMCIFEYIYFSRPDSMIFEHGVYQVRKQLGLQLALEAPVEGADVVVPMPASGNYAALGFSQGSGVPFEYGVIRNHYVGRTFIQPSSAIRNLGVRLKLNPVREILQDRKIVVIDDSIVRGTTSKLRTRALREAGAREIHMRISCPPIKFPCFYGVDFSSKGELIACSKTVEQICDFIGADSLAYLSLEGMFRAMPLPAKDFCSACFTGKYPVKVVDEYTKTCLECRTSECLHWP